MAVLASGPRLEDGERVRVVEQQHPAEERCKDCGEPVEVVGHSKLGGDLYRCGCTVPPTEDQSQLERAARRGRDAAGIASPEGLGTTPGPPEPTQGNDPCPACAQPGGAHSPTCPIFKGRDLASGDEWDPAAVDAVVELADSPGFVLDGEGVQQNEDPDGKALAEILAGRGWPPRSGHHLRRLERKLAAALELLRFKGAARDA